MTEKEGELERELKKRINIQGEKFEDRSEDINEFKGGLVNLANSLNTLIIRFYEFQEGFTKDPEEIKRIQREKEERCRKTRELLQKFRLYRDNSGNKIHYA